MTTIRLQVDGAEAVLAAETIEMPVQRIDARPRYLVGLVLALATAAVAIGAIGPRVESAADSAIESACQPATVVAADPAADPAPVRGVGAEGRPSAAPWWHQPGPRVWVDPQTGRLRQDQPAVRHMTDDRGRHR